MLSWLVRVMGWLLCWFSGCLPTAAFCCHSLHSSTDRRFRLVLREISWTELALAVSWPLSDRPTGSSMPPMRCCMLACAS